MISDCLLEIVISKIDIGDDRKCSIKSYLENYDDSQLYYVMNTPKGLLAHDISIFFFPGVGFRCSNDARVTGRLPICNVIQNILNKKFQSISSSNNDVNSK